MPDFATLLDASSTLFPVLIQVAEQTPDKIITVPVDITEGLQRSQAETLARAIGVDEDSVELATEQMLKLYDMFIEVRACCFLVVAECCGACCLVFRESVTSWLPGNMLRRQPGFVD